MERFKSKYVVSDNLVLDVDGKKSPCWLWIGSKRNYARGNKASGVFWVGSYKPAYRVSYEINVGPIPDDHSVIHISSCSNSLCVNPKHLKCIPSKSGFKGNNNPVSILTTEIVDGWRKKYFPLKTMVELASEYGVSRQTISLIMSGKSGKSGNGKLTLDQINTIRSSYKPFPDIAALQREVLDITGKKVSKATISSALNGRSWKNESPE